MKWLSDAVVYEWTDEYGEVGPELPELEKELYEDPDLARPGIDFGLTDAGYDVKVEGVSKVQPFRNVSLSNISDLLFANTHAVRGRWSASSCP